MNERDADVSSPVGCAALHELRVGWFNLNGVELGKKCSCHMKQELVVKHRCEHRQPGQQPHVVCACLLTAREEIPSFAYGATEILMQNKSSGLNRTSDQGERNGV